MNCDMFPNLTTLAEIRFGVSPLTIDDSDYFHFRGRLQSHWLIYGPRLHLKNFQEEGVIDEAVVVREAVHLLIDNPSSLQPRAELNLRKKNVKSSPSKPLIRSNSPKKIDPFPHLQKFWKYKNFNHTSLKIIYYKVITLFPYPMVFIQHYL